MTELKSYRFDDFDDLPTKLYMLYYMTIDGDWALNPHIFPTKDSAEYIGSFYERSVFIIPVNTQSPILIRRSKKVKKIKVRKVKVPKNDT